MGMYTRGTGPARMDAVRAAKAAARALKMIGYWSTEASFIIPPPKKVIFVSH